MKEGKQAAGMQWTLGDLAIEVSNEARYGDRALERFAEETGVAYKSIKEYQRVARAYPEKSMRMANFAICSVLAAQKDRLELTKTTKTWRDALEIVRSRNQLLSVDVDDYSRMADDIAAKINEWLRPDTDVCQQIEDLISHRDEISPISLENLVSVIGLQMRRARTLGLRLWNNDETDPEQLAIGGLKSCTTNHSGNTSRSRNHRSMVSAGFFLTRSGMCMSNGTASRVAGARTCLMTSGRRQSEMLSGTPLS